MSILHVWSLSGEVGLIIVIPLLIFLFIGLKVDQMLNTKPLFIIGGMGIAAVFSFYILLRKIRQLNKPTVTGGKP